MSVELKYVSQVEVEELLTTGVPAATGDGATIKHNQYNSSHALSGTSAVPVTTVAAFEQALSAGTATIDLTALTGTNGAAVNGNGLKVQVAKFKNKPGNAQIEIDVGASNGYNLLGATFEVILLAGQEITIFGNEATPDIGASAKTLDLVGTGTEILECIIVMG